jgi:hypothetical protein
MSGTLLISVHNRCVEPFWRLRLCMRGFYKLFTKPQGLYCAFLGAGVWGKGLFTGPVGFDSLEEFLVDVGAEFLGGFYVLPGRLVVF